MNSFYLVSTLVGISPPLLLEIIMLGSWYLLKSDFKNNCIIFWTDIDTLRDCSTVNIEISTE